MIDKAATDWALVRQLVDGDREVTAYLVNKGVPWCEAVKMDEAERQAYVIAFGQADGNQWDWETKSWKNPAR